MIALKLLFQSFAGVGSVLVCAGGGYYVMKEGNEDNFYLVSASAPATSPSTDLLTSSTTNGTNTKKQNYKCLSTEDKNKEADDSCLLYSLSPKTPNTTIKISDIQIFIKDTTKTSTVVTKTEAKSEIKINKFFLLKAHKKLHTTWTFDATKTIKLVEKTAATAESSKTYSTLTVHAKISSEAVEGKTSFAIVKYLKDATISIAANATVTCKLTATETPKPCFLTLLSDPSPITDFEKIVFTSITIPATQQATVSITKEKHYLVQFKTPAMHTIEELSAELMILVSPTTEETDGSTTKEAELKIQTQAFILPTTSGAIAEAIIIK